MGKHSGATEFDPEADKALSEKWRKSELSSVVREQEPSAFGSGNDWSFSKLCPEVAGDRFGWFASGLYTYADEIDRDSAHARLGKMGDAGEEWRWAWAAITPMHYSECPLYSLLLHKSEPASEKNAQSEDEILQLNPSFHGIGINLKALFSTIRRKLSRNAK
jgi:hypothetical protein